MSDQQVPEVWRKFGEVCGVTAHEAREILATTIMPKASKAETLAFIAIAGQYGLNPILKEIHAFPQGGKVQAIVGIDGWLKIAARHPEHEAIETEEVFQDGQHVATTARIFKRGLERPTVATEWMDECRRNTPTWKQSPKRMLRHRAVIQAIRMAYGVGGIMEQDEAERIQDHERKAETTSSRRDTLLARAAAVVEPEPEPEPAKLEVSEYQPTAEDMADWTTPVTTDPEAAQ